MAPPDSIAQLAPTGRAVSAASKLRSVSACRVKYGRGLVIGDDMGTRRRRFTDHFMTATAAQLNVCPRQSLKATGGNKT